MSKAKITRIGIVEGEKAIGLAFVFEENAKQTHFTEIALSGYTLAELREISEKAMRANQQ